MKVSLEDISVKKAQEWLKHNTTNRPVRQATVLRYSAAIKRGEWVVNGETLKFNCDGRLIDGQHRLYSIVAAGKGIKSYVVREVPENAFDTIDQGANRTLADVIHRHGEDNPKLLAAAVRTLAWFAEPTMGRKHWLPLTGKQALAILDANPGLRSSLKAAQNANKALPASQGAALHYLFSKKDSALADTFFEALASGESLKKTDPVYRLRERLIERRNKAVQIRSIVILALAVKAWNATRKSMPVKSLQWRIDEAFPEIE